MNEAATQRRRLWTQAGFFILFVVAPVFDIFRYDLTQNHAIILGCDWRLGLDELFAGRISSAQAALNILLRLFLPLLGGFAPFGISVHIHSFTISFPVLNFTGSDG